MGLLKNTMCLYITENFFLILSSKCYRLHNKFSWNVLQFCNIIFVFAVTLYNQLRIYNFYEHFSFSYLIVKSTNCHISVFKFSNIFQFSNISWMLGLTFKNVVFHSYWGLYFNFKFIYTTAVVFQLYNVMMVHVTIILSKGDSNWL